jgi:heat shock protein HslJ
LPSGLGVAVAFLILAPAPLPATISATSWQLQSMTFDRTRRYPLAEHPITLRFRPQDQTASGSAGCNDYSLTYTSNHSYSVHVYADRTTFVACTPAETMLLESSYLDALRHVASYHVDGRLLTLTDSNGDLTLTYVPSTS